MESPDSPPVPTRSRKAFGFSAVLFIVAFVLNWYWEIIQMPAYVGMDSKTWKDATSICAIATLGDVGITLIIYFIGALAVGRLLWPLKDARNAYFISALLGMLSAAFVECRALAVGRWAYNDKMPIVPYLHLGMWPLLQLTLLVPASIWLAALW